MMIPSEVNGVAVIADEPCPSNLPPRNGKQLYYKKIRKLLLADDSTTNVCTVCGKYADPASFKVVAHMAAHSRGSGNGDKNIARIDSPAKPATPHLMQKIHEAVVKPPTVTAASLDGDEVEEVSVADASSNGHGPASLDDGQTVLGAVEAIISDRAKWMSRAFTAERDLAELRAAVRAAQEEPETPEPVKSPRIDVPQPIIDRAIDRLELLGELNRTELRAITGLSTGRLAELAEYLVSEGYAEEQRRVHRRGGAVATVLTWSGRKLSEVNA
jgi:hypothetical protein